MFPSVCFRRPFRGALLSATIFCLSLLGSIILYSPVQACDIKEPTQPATRNTTVHRVIIENLVYEPAELTIQVGDTVEWINRDIVPHTATTEESGWDTGNLNKGESGAIIFDQAGSMDYICTYHPVMMGKIIVVEQ